MSLGHKSVSNALPDMRIGEAAGCKAMSDILNRIGDKWSVMVVGSLKDQPVRFNQLRREINGISQRMLTRTLRNLERDGLVTRTIYAEIPPRVEYELTDIGRTLLPVIGALWEWAVSHRDDVISSRSHYDAVNDKNTPVAAE